MNNYKTVRLYGQLGAMFGRVHRLVISSPAEAVRALSVTLPGFENYMMTAHKRGFRFAVFKGKQNITKDELRHGAGDEEIRIAPILMGSKSGGIFQTILGAVMVAVGVVMTVVSGGVASPLATQLMLAGGAMMIGGVVQMLSPQTTGLSSREDPDNKPSYAFGGPVNTTAIGNPVPLPYGLRERGGAIISAGIYTDDYQ